MEIRHSKELWNGMQLAELLVDGQVIAGLVAKTEQQYRMDAVSTMDHVNEPRYIKDYSLEEGTWDGQPVTYLNWDVFQTGVGVITLGAFRNREEGQAILDHLKSNGTE